MLALFKTRSWHALFGIVLFVGMMAAGYYYNLTFIQLGLEDFGTRHLGLEATIVAREMAFLALLTCLIAIGFGWWMQKRGWSRRFQFKLRLSFGVVLSQTLLTLICPLITNDLAFIAWLVGVSLTLGIGVPVMFSLTVDLVPVRSRGMAAALVTAVAYFLAETLSAEWTFDYFRRQSLLVLGVGVIGMGILGFVRLPWLNALARQHELPAYSVGRFVHAGKNWYLPGFILIMFGIYFLDSLGFLRLLKTPIYMDSAWQSTDFNTRAFIGMVHVIGALAAGVLYSALRERSLFMWIFGTFALAHLQYTFHIQTGSLNAVLSMPMLYALAVSLYTVVNFAIWADLSTPDTISLNSALGVALSGWTATFLSTALALYWGERIPLELHIRIVDSLAMFFFLALLALAFFEPIRLSIRKMSS